MKEGGRRWEAGEVRGVGSREDVGVGKRWGGGIGKRISTKEGVIEMERTNESLNLGQQTSPLGQYGGGQLTRRWPG